MMDSEFAWPPSIGINEGYTTLLDAQREAIRWHDVHYIDEC